MLHANAFKLDQSKIGSSGKWLKVGMGTNTENGIRIFGITIRIFVLRDRAGVGSGDQIGLEQFAR